MMELHLLDRLVIQYSLPCLEAKKWTCDASCIVDPHKVSLIIAGRIVLRSYSRVISFFRKCYSNYEICMYQGKAKLHNI